MKTLRNRFNRCAFALISGSYLLALETGWSAVVNRGPYLQSAGHDRITICWRTDVPTTSEVEFGVNLGSMGVPVIVPGLRTDHFVTLTGLQPDSRYHYRIKGNPDAGAAVNVGGANFWFRTSPSPGTAKPARFWVVGDSGYQFPGPVTSYNSYMNATAAAGKQTSAFIMLGDNAYDRGLDVQYQGAVFNRYAALLRNSPVWSTYGNHEGYAVPHPYTAYTPHEAIFQFPTEGENGGVASGSERYYSFDLGEIHFICLDTNTPGNYDDLPGAPYGMVDWLLDDLKATTANWIIAFMHQGPYSRGKHNSDVSADKVQTRAHVVPLLEAYGADLVLYGHSHVYERSRMIDGHYGMSNSWNPVAMEKWPGNGSEVGGVDSAGNFKASLASAEGAFQKPSATGRAGAVYITCGASSGPENWWGGIDQLVNPSPHPAHLVSLKLLGSMVVEVESGRLNAQYHDMHGTVRDDFTILKGSEYKLGRAQPVVRDGLVGVAYPVARSGALAYSEEVPVEIETISGNGVSTTPAVAKFGAGESHGSVEIIPSGPDATARFRAELLPTMRPVQPGAAPRSAYRISGGPQEGHFAATPAASWFASRFGQPPPDDGVWGTDEDGDGLSLMLEYALGGEPDENAAGILPRGTVEDGSFVFRYVRPHGRTDLAYRVVATDDLAAWPAQALTDSPDGPPTAFGEPRKAQVPIESLARFVRLEVTTVP